MKNLLFLLLLIAAVFIAVSAPPVEAAEAKVEICHVPPGNPGNARIISIGASAVAAHCAHGDPGVLVVNGQVYAAHNACGIGPNPCD